MHAIVGREADRHKPNARLAKRVELVRQFYVINIRRTDYLEWRVGATSDGHRGLEQADAGVKQCLVEAAHIGRRIRPGLAGGIEQLATFPTFDFHDLQLDANVALGVDHPRQLAGGHTVLHRDVVVCDELAWPKSYRPGNGGADRVHAVEHDEFQTGLSGRLHRQSHR